MMDTFWYWAALALAKILQALPIRIVAALGRCGGGAAYWIDYRHRHVASENLRHCFPGMSDQDRRAMVREHFKRLGENYASAVTTAAISSAQLTKHLEIFGTEKLAANPRGAIVALGHFGNFELYTRIAAELPRLKGATSYRALKQPRLNLLVRELRARSGCLLFDRRHETKAMLRALREGGVVLGLLSDQHAGHRGLRIPFFGFECSTTAAPALLAQRYRLPLFSAACFRVGLARWRIEVSEEIPTRTDFARRSTEEIMRDVNAAFEAAARRDLANWLWVHDRWRFVKEKRALASASIASAVPRRV
jgi:KDO2-lipid IV(A) lauroyltransferase